MESPSCSLSIHHDELLADVEAAQIVTEDGLEEEEEEVLVEPRFKYSRLLNDISRLFDNDSASCIAVHDKFIAIGCKSGRICVFDHLGNVNRESTARHHKCEVTALSIDASGCYFASCANDYTVSVFGIGSGEYNERVEGLKMPAKSLALAEDFSRHGGGHRLVVGNRDLLLYETTFPIGRRRCTPLYQGLERDGLITTISWNGVHIAFTNESGTRIYDIKMGRNITLIQSMHKIEKYYSTRFPPKHSWLDSSTFAVGWANTICVCGIRDRHPDRPNELANKHGHILHKWVLEDLFIAGLSFTVRSYSSAGVEAMTAARPARNGLLVTAQKWQEIVAFGIKVSRPEEAILDDSKVCLPVESTMLKASISHEKSTSPVKSTASEVSTFTTPPASTAVIQAYESHKVGVQLTLLQPGGTLDSYQLVAEDGIEMRGADIRRLNHFSLAGLPADNLLYLLGPKELIEACPCSTDDRITWLVENQLYSEAMDFAVRNSERLKEWSVGEVGAKLISHLIDEKRDFAKAASLLPTVCGRSAVEWDHYFDAFENHNQVLKLVPVLPTHDPRLEPERYESVLTAALYARTKLFLTLVTQWNFELYRVGSIADRTIRRIVDAQRGDNGGRGEEGPTTNDDFLNLSRALAILYAHDRKFTKAIDIYLAIKDPEVFALVGRQRLFGHVKERICELMEINSSLTIRLLLDNEESVPPAKLQILTTLDKYPKLQGTKPFQIAYLNSLISRGQSGEYSDKLVALYAKHDRPELLPFLRKCENFKIDRALQICREKRYTEETVYLLGRSGNRSGALDLIVNELKRFDHAIAFCTEHEDDVELWNKLAELAMGDASHISMLLCAAGTFISPLSIIGRIPPDMEIPQLKQSLMKVLRDADLHLTLLNDSQAVAAQDVVDLFLERIQPDVYEVDKTMVCILCHSQILGAAPGGDIRIFRCAHVVHSKCLTEKFTRVPSTSRERSNATVAVAGGDNNQCDVNNPFAERSTLATLALSVGMSDSGTSLCPLCYEQNLLCVIDEHSPC